MVALRKESVDRNIFPPVDTSSVRSLSARRAWIETLASRLVDMSAAVALRKESVDRNYKNLPKQSIHHKVALRKESVDRNLGAMQIVIIVVVALRKESVDRNQGVHYDNYNLHWSLSARRAWIETCPGRIWSTALAWSLSARRAWIETIDYIIDYVNDAVALRKESVDRNVR